MKKSTSRVLNMLKEIGFLIIYFSSYICTYCCKGYFGVLILCTLLVG